MFNTGLNALSLRGTQGQGDGVALPQSPSEAAPSPQGYTFQQVLRTHRYKGVLIPPNKDIFHVL